MVILHGGDKIKTNEKIADLFFLPQQPGNIILET